ncbi:peptide MFS transporter [Phenylobacterium sp.]|jgi:POT family proton-dependent oligopeptide transporter|uniref:peptide MFS transporter n=1 Tax=Phenylobacterium sp. TaxID=1871053 RepID=UPI002E30E86B|nr:peptide MFS transporter [Phenylobacterium sp.]HEX4710505.1 peptide MFS transporter [Phenylobacterium sp.]
MTAITGETDVRPGQGEVFGHPRGLVVLAGTELWDRISFHGMQALLTLYMVEQLFLPGHIERIVGFAGFRSVVEHITGPLSVQALATQIFGIYVGLVYFTPSLGGALGDRVLGRTRTVTLGALLMTAGHFCMAFDQSFLLALLCLILGAGCFRGNLTPQVGELYPAGDRRRVVAFQLYASMINLGAFIAPLATGALGKAFGWHVGFAFAGFGMLIGLIVYLSGRSWLAPDAPRGPRAAAAPLTPAERRMVLLLLGLVPIAALFWIAQSQVWNTYNLWVRDHIQLQVGGFTMPVPWLQALDGLSPFVCLPPVLFFWRWQAARGREPNEFTKAAIGCFIFAASTAWLGAAPLVTDAHGRTPLLWAVAFHFASNLGWLYFAPTMTALFSRAAPKSVNATMMGVFLLSVFLGSVVSGRLGGLYEHVSPSGFWMLHAGLVGLGGVILLAIGARFSAAFAAAPEGAAAAAA